MLQNNSKFSGVTVAVSGDLILNLLDFSSQASLKKEEWRFLEEWDSRIRKSLEEAIVEKSNTEDKLTVPDIIT